MALHFNPTKFHDLLSWNNFLIELETYLKMGVVTPAQSQKLVEEVESLKQAIAAKLSDVQAKAQADADAVAAGTADVQTLVDNTSAAIEEIKASLAPASSANPSPLDSAVNEVHNAANADAPPVAPATGS